MKESMSMRFSSVLGSLGNLVVFVLISLLTSCGSNEGQEASKDQASSDLNACTMISLSDIESIMGEKVEVLEGFPKGMKLQGGKIINSRCNFTGVSSEKLVGLNVTFAPDNKAKYPKTLDEYLKISGEEMGAPDEDTLKKSMAVEEIGNFAVWNQELGGLLVYSGGYKILTTIGHLSKGTEEGDLDRAKAISQKVLGRL